MRLAVDNTSHRLRDIAEAAGQIVEREHRDMWRLGELLTEARVICDDPQASAAEGIEGKTGDKRFSQWKSNYNNLLELDNMKIKRAMNLHRCFGRRRQRVSGWHISALYELAAPQNDDVREEILREHPNGMKVLDMRKVIKSKRAAEPAANEEVPKVPEVPKTQTASLAQELAAALDVTPDHLRAATEDMQNPLYMAAFGLLEAEELIRKELGSLSSKNREAALAAVVKIAKYQQQQFNNIIKTQLPKYNQELKARLTDELSRAKEATKAALAGQIAMDEVGLRLMLKADGKRFLQALHPDKHNGDPKYVKLFQDFRGYMDKYKA